MERLVGEEFWAEMEVTIASVIMIAEKRSFMLAS
jgi:hypothetical protein